MQEDNELIPEESITGKMQSSNSELTIHGLIKNEQNFKKLVHLTKEEFNHLLEEASAYIQQTTFRGTVRKQSVQAISQHSIHSILFLNLFWLSNYPTLDLMGALFYLHQRSITQILKRTLVGLKQTLEHEIAWPTDEEFERDVNNFTCLQFFLSVAAQLIFSCHLASFTYIEQCLVQQKIKSENKSHCL